MTELPGEGDEVIIKEFRTTVQLPGVRGAWVAVPGGLASSQVFLPFEMMEKVLPELHIGDVWKGANGREWYVRKMWTACGDDLMIEAFDSPSVTYGSSNAGVTVRSLDKFFTEQNPVLVRRR